MEYRRLGRTGLRISAIALGGHWKGLAPPLSGTGYDEADWRNLQNPAFLENRRQVLAKALELGVTYVDACSPQEILVYSRLLRELGGRMHFGFSWHTREPRDPAWRSAARLVEGFEQSLREAGLDHAGLWRISLPVEEVEPSERRRVEEATAGALERAKRQGKARFGGVSSHDPAWLKSFVKDYPEQIEVVLFPVTGASRRRVSDSLFDTLDALDLGVLAIKPFAGGALFEGDGRDDVRARHALGNVLANPRIAATLPGFANARQIENALCAAPGPVEATGLLARAPRWLKAWQEV